MEQTIQDAVAGTSSLASISDHRGCLLEVIRVLRTKVFAAAFTGPLKTIRPAAR